jgi:glucose-1-phosphate cytidylyltransferase
MKVVILAGGLGTRLSEETQTIPKPMVRIGKHPIIWHIMKIYSTYGFNEFVICLGYKGDYIKSYFADHFRYNNNFTIDLKSGKTEFHSENTPPWNVTLVDTGEETLTGGRLKRVKKYVDSDTFMMTYGDGVADINLKELVKFHKSHGKTATVTAVRPAPRFGTLHITEEGKVEGFREKVDSPWVNGGFFVLSKNVFDYIEGDSAAFERQPMEKLAKYGELFAYKHSGFWKPMDMLKDKIELEEIWAKDNPPWKIWKD